MDRQTINETACNILEKWNLYPVVGLGLGGPEARLKRGPSDDVIIISQPW